MTSTPLPARAQLIDAVDFDDASPATLDFLKATGVEGVIVRVPSRMADGDTHAEDFIAFRKHVESHGLELSCLHSGGLPKKAIVYGREGREAEAHAWAQVIRGIGAAGVPLTATTFQGIGHFRTPPATGRGGALLSTYRKADLDANAGRDWEHGARPHDAISEREMWASLQWFYERILPVAEESGVRVCLHPDDPPVHDALGGAARITSSIDQYLQIFDMIPSEANAMLFCQGCVAEMGGNVLEAIHAVGTRRKIGIVHFRDIVGTPDDFVEVFIDEGQNDMLAAMQAYKAVGFRGPFMMDHTPQLPKPFDHWHGHAYANGYIKALIRVVYGRA
jgi:mannonate dehydratase